MTEFPFFSDRLPPLQEPARQYRGYLTDDQILEGVKAMSKNSQQLLEDATLFFDNGRYGRAAALAILCVEENFKKLTLFIYPMVRESPELCKEFWRNVYTNHKFKSSAPATVPFVLGETDENQRTEQTKVLGDWANGLKQRGLYADCYEGDRGPVWSIPSRDVTEEDARAALELARSYEVPDPDDETLRRIIAGTGSSGDPFEVLVGLANEMEKLGEGGATSGHSLGRRRTSGALSRPFSATVVGKEARMRRDNGTEGNQRDFRSPC